MLMGKDVLLTVRQACDRLGIHPQTLRNWDRAGRIRVVRYPGGKRRIPLSEIERIMAGKEAGV
jgi:putative resolvase